MSKSRELQIVLSLVRKLTILERRTVANAIRMQDGIHAASASSYQRFSEDWLLPGIEHELKKRGFFLVAMTPEYLQKWAPNYVKQSIEVRTALKAKLKQPTQAQLLALGRLCAASLVEFILARRDERFGPRAVLLAVPEIATALNRSYPGYLASGLLHMLLK